MTLDAKDVLMDNTLRKAGYGAVLEAALEGDSDAQCYLGMIWKEKIEGIPEPTTLEQALRWYSIAAETAYDGLRQDAIRHRDDILKSLQRVRGNNVDTDRHRGSSLETILKEVGNKPPVRVSQDQVLAGRIFQTFRALNIASTSIDDIDVRLSYLEWRQNEEDKFENDPYIGRIMPIDVSVARLMQTMKGLGVKVDQIADGDTRSAYATWIKKGEK